ncbi:cytochrome P450 [Embleya sp. AB8]|uniref:cytochrome P450 n=1 Tax=Embleya sp. AB8 TaxID=3156304 RepID=UPI003C71F236
MSVSGDSAAVPIPNSRPRDRPFDPPDVFRHLRAADPVTKVPLPDGSSLWLITRDEDARQVLVDRRFTTASTPDLLRPRDADLEARRVGNLLRLDPPEHTRVRRLLVGAFTPSRLRQMRTDIRLLVSDVLETMARLTPPVDLIAHFALPIPSLVICELLGVPYADREGFQRRTGTLLDFAQPTEKVTATAAEAREYMAGLVARERDKPGDGIIGTLVRDHADALTDAELIGLANHLLEAGHETVAAMLGLGTLVLLGDPSAAARLRDDETAVPNAVEELLRYLTIIPYALPRTALADVPIADTTIAAGDHVVISLASANRDETTHDHPDRFDLDRPSTPHLAFGHGIHHCLGAQLARTQLTIAIPALLRKFPTLHPASSRTDLRFRTSSAVYGVRELPVAW